ncbi:sigma-54-dependent Fis family transcriptional regulator [Streptomyces sp. NPDC003393]
MSTPHAHSVRAAREEFLATGRIPDRLRPAIRPEIAASWSRSRAYGAARSGQQLPFSPDFAPESGLLAAARQVLDRLAEELGGLGGALILADGHARLIRSWIPDESVQRPLRRILADPGADCSEELVGTNGIGTALADGHMKIIGGAEHWADLHLDMTCVAAPILHPVTRRSVGVINVTMMEQQVHPALSALVRWGVDAVRERLLDQSGRAERALFEEFMAHRRTDRPSLILSKRLFLADPAVADLYPDLDPDELWERLQSDGNPTELELPDGTALPVRVTAVGDGSDGRGLLVELRSEGRPALRRSGNRPPGPSPALASAISAAAEALALRLPLLVIGEKGAGKTTLAQRVAHTRYPENGIARFDGHTALDDPGRWCALVRAAATRSPVIVLRHLDQLCPRTAALLVPLLDELTADPTGPQLMATAVNATRHDNPEAAASVLALFGRFARATVAVPPLRERPADLPSLIAELSARTDRRARWSAEALAVLTRYPWPGNVRELESVVHRTLSGASGLIRVTDLPLDIRQGAGRLRLTRMERAERDAILTALDASGGNKVIAAEELGISRSSLYRKIERYRLADSGQVEVRNRA